MDDKQDDMDKINEVLNSIYPIVKNGKIKKFKDLILAMDTIENKKLLCTCYNTREIELISLICKYNKKKHLNYLLYESHILHLLTNSNKIAEIKCKEDAFYYAMRSINFDILEMLYDYWSGDLHWLGHKKEYNKFDVENLIQLRGILKSAFDRYQQLFESTLKINPRFIFNIESLMASNVFQIELYSKLNELKHTLVTWEDEPEDIIRVQETKAIKKMILAVFDIYEKHSEQCLLENSVFEVNDSAVDDTSSLMHKTRIFQMYEVFFKKIDYNLCLLILDNLHLLKLRLSMPKNSYQQMESKLYYFIYQITSKWGLYMQTRKLNKEIQLITPIEGRVCCFTINVDERNNVYNIIYLERRDFEKAMKYFKNELVERNIEDNIRKSQIKLPPEDNNCLMLLPHLRDDYSLRRISQHIAQLHSISFKYENKYSFLFIERALQVVGEFLKSTDESLHLQQTTEALVKAELSVEVVNDLKALRNLFCHAKNGEFLKRIEIEVNYSYIYDLISKELLYVKMKIDEVIKVHEPILMRYLTQNALKILQNRQFEMPEMVAEVHYNIVHNLRQIPIEFIRHKIQKKYYEEKWAPQGFTKSLFVEVNMLSKHSNELEKARNRAIINIRNNIGLKFAFYIARIKDSLRVMLNHIQRWKQIVNVLKKENDAIDLLEYPNEEDANRIKSYSNKVFLEDGSFIQTVEVNELFANVERHWKFIEGLLQFIVHKTRLFYETLEELKFSMYSYRLEELSRYNYKCQDMEKKIIDYLDMMEKKLNTMNVIKRKASFGNPTPATTCSKNIREFHGIRELTRKLMIANTLTEEEKKHLVSTIKKTDLKNNVSKYSAVEIMINKIETEIAIPKKEYTKFIELVNLEHKSQKMLLNLVMGHKRNPLLPQCLSKRVFILEEICNQQPKNLLVLRYKFDKTFRVILEVLLFDIFVIMECNKSNPFIKKSSKLLTEINLRNILTHGSPLLEVVGKALDANDLPTELVTKALEFIKDKQSIEALCTLNELDFDFTQIHNVTGHTEYAALLNDFKTSCRWKDYLKLIPEYKQNIYIKNKNLIDKNTLALLKAVKSKDAALVKDCIDKDADVNFIDNHKKAVIHYAAMNGNVNVLEVLLNNGADVNIPNKENKLTALHYSAMNNFIDSVEYLLEKGANSIALDDKGRTPVYWAGQRNHINVCRILTQAMKNAN